MALWVAKECRYFLSALSLVGAQKWGYTIAWNNGDCDVTWLCKTVFKGAFVKFRKVTMNFMLVRPSIYPHGTTRLPLDGFSWNLIFDYFWKHRRSHWTDFHEVLYLDIFGNTVAPTGRIFMKFEIRIFLETLSLPLDGFSWNLTFEYFLKHLRSHWTDFHEIWYSHIFWNTVAPTGRIFMKFDIRIFLETPSLPLDVFSWNLIFEYFLETLSRKFKFHWNLIRMTGTLREGP